MPLRVFAVSVLYFLFWFAHSLQHNLPEYLLRMSFCFLFGVELYRLLPYFSRWKDRQRIWSSLVILGPLTAVLLVKYFGTSKWAILIDPILGLTMIGLYFVRGGAQYVYTNPLALKIGAFSYSTYLLHGVFSKILFTINHSVKTIPFIPPVISLAVLTLFTFYISQKTQRYFTDPAGDWVLAKGHQLYDWFGRRKVEWIEKNFEMVVERQGEERVTLDLLVAKGTPPL